MGCVCEARALIIIAPLPIQLTAFKEFLSFSRLGDPTKLVEMKKNQTINLEGIYASFQGLRFSAGRKAHKIKDG